MGLDHNGRKCLPSCLFFWAVLVFGLVQWSFLPVLIQTDFQTGNPVLSIQSYHTAKFAAPFKYIFGDSSQATVATARFELPSPVQAFAPIMETLTPVFSEGSVTQRQSRAPPSL